MSLNATEIDLTCPRCGERVQSDWGYCPFCSMALEAPAGERATLSDRIRYIRRDSEVRSRRQAVYRWGLTFATIFTVLLIVGGGVLLFHPAFVPSLFQPPEPRVWEILARVAEPEPTELPEAPVLQFQWVKVPAGKFRYGRPGSTVEVELDAFEIMQYEVTNQQWWDYLWDEQNRLRRTLKFRRSVPRHWGWDANAGEFEFPQVPNGLHDLPVVNITWYQANDFCTVYLQNKLKCAETYLPTSAQWELAARGFEDERRYPWGDQATLDQGSYQVQRCNVRETGNRRPVDVRRFPKDRSPFGVLGMAGNVAEFVGYLETNDMAYKGGSFEDPVVDAQIHIQTAIPPRSTFTWSNVGFRAARDLEE